MSDGQVKCSSCPFIAADWPSLRAHFQVSHEYCQIRDCKYCNNFFVCVKDHTDHLVAEHSYIKCECSRVFRYQGRLELHMSRAHGSQKKQKTEETSYSVLKGLTDEYLQKIREILRLENCQNLGGLHSSLEQFISSEPSGKLGEDSQRSVLTFVMHAAEIAITSSSDFLPATSPAASKTAEATGSELAESQPSGTSDRKDDKNREKPVNIFVTEKVERMGRKKRPAAVASGEKSPSGHRKLSQSATVESKPVVSHDWQALYRHGCDECHESFSTRAEMEMHKYHKHRQQAPVESQGRSIKCSAYNCQELFDDEDSLLRHLVVAHSNS